MIDRQGFEHLSYEELRAIVLEYEGNDETFIEDLFKATFDTVIKLCIATGDPTMPEQDTEIRILQLLVKHDMIGHNLRLFFSALDYKVGYIVTTLIAYCDALAGQPGCIHVQAFDAIHKGDVDIVTEFFLVPNAAMLILDMYKLFVHGEQRFAPFHQDLKSELLNQISFDMSTYPTFKRIDLTIDQNDGEGHFIETMDMIQALVAINSIPNATIFPGGVPIIATNPLGRAVHGTEMSSLFDRAVSGFCTYVLQRMTSLGMYAGTTSSKVQDVVHNHFAVFGFTPAFVVALYANCNNEDSRFSNVMMSMYHYLVVEPMKEANDFYRNIYIGIQYYLVHHRPHVDSWSQVGLMLQDEKILLGNVASILIQEDMEPQTVDDLNSGPKLN